MANNTRAEVVEKCRRITSYDLNAMVGPTDVQRIQWLQEIGLVPYLNGSHILCPYTRNQGHDMVRRSAELAKLKWAFRCRTCRRAGIECQYGLATKTWLSGSNLSIKTIIELTYSWVMGLGVTQARQECRIGSNSTVVDWYSFCREVCRVSIRNRIGLDRIGGNGHIVEVDEHFFVKRKYNRGRFLVTEQVAVWGAFDLTTKRVVIQRIPNQRHDTLLALIAAFVEQDSEIHSDGWLRHREQDLLDMNMRMSHWVNHSAGTFAEVVQDPFTGQDITVTTNHLERQWRELDKYIKSYQNDEHIDQYIDHYIYCKNLDFANISDGEKFGNFLYDVSQVYPGLTRKRNIDADETLILYHEP